MRRTLGTALIALAALGQAAPAPGAALELEDCQLSGPFGLRHVEARCGTLAVPENPADPNGRRIELFVAVVPADSPNPLPDAVTLLAGGPGQAATEAYASLPGAFAELNAKRDILLVDQRGTGNSHPLDCPIEPDELWAPEVDRESVQQAARRCLDGFEEMDPRFYTTPIAMDDLDRVREALGYEQINLVGVSYGTRAAQVYLRRHPERVRSVVLGGVVPMTEPLGLAHAANLDAALDAVFDRCAASQPCHEAFPEPGVALQTLLERLWVAPQQVAFAHPRTGEWTELPFSALALGGAVRMLSYTPDGQALLPLLIHDAHASGRLDRLAAQALMVSDSLMEQLSRGMELSVLCAEDEPFYPAHWQPPADSVMGAALVKYARWACEVWPRGDIPADYHEPVESDAPVLLLSGEFDPVTPPAFAEKTMAGFSNARHLVLPGQGHALLGRGCTGRVMADFVQEAGFESLDTECLENLGPMPFFVDFTGPAP